MQNQLACSSRNTLFFEHFLVLREFFCTLFLMLEARRSMTHGTARPPQLD
jgi:hypothetical protein